MPKYVEVVSRFAIFLIYFWFGYLKLFDSSPANALVESLLQTTLPVITFDQFIVSLGLYEILIGIVFLIPGKEKLGLALLIPHMFTIFMPLILLPAITWKSFLVPTLEGQYIIKNLLIIAVALNLASTNQVRRS